MEKILIDGASSFVGYHLVQYFQKSTEVVFSGTKPLDSYTGIQKKRLEKLSSLSTFVQFDFTNQNEVEEALNQVKPSLYIHHGGYTKNYTSLDYDELEATRINVNPLHHIFRLSSMKGVKGLILTGTSMEYGDSDNPHDERERCQPSTEYGKSKLRMTKTAEELSSQFKLPTRVARVFNPFGSMDRPNTLFSLVMNALKEEKIIDLSSCEQTRNIFHVETLVEQYKALIEDMLVRKGFDVVNIAHRDQRTLKESLLKICELTKSDCRLLNFGAREMRDGEVKKLLACTKKLESKLGFQFSSSLDEDLSKLVSDWEGENVR